MTKNHSEMQSKRLITDKQAARYLSMSESWLRQVRMEGNRKGRMPGPPYIRIGRAIRYRLEELNRWLDEHRVVAGVASHE